MYPGLRELTRILWGAHSTANDAAMCLTATDPECSHCVSKVPVEVKMTQHTGFRSIIRSLGLRDVDNLEDERIKI